MDKLSGLDVVVRRGKGPTRDNKVIEVDVSLGDQQSGLDEAHLEEST